MSNSKLTRNTTQGIVGRTEIDLFLPKGTTAETTEVTDVVVNYTPSTYYL